MLKELDDMDCKVIAEYSNDSVEYRIILTRTLSDGKKESRGKVVRKKLTENTQRYLFHKCCMFDAINPEEAVKNWYKSQDDIIKFVEANPYNLRGLK